jgi:predicted PurR-regulated permease PerM
MKLSFYISVAASALCLVLSVVVLIVGNINQGLQNDIQTQQSEYQKQQDEINRGNAISQQVGPALLQDMAASSTKNEKMKQLLAANGYTVTVNTPAPGSSPAPGATAPHGTPAAPATGEAPGLRP